MTTRCVMGIDVGTSGCKCIAVGEDGGVLASAVAPYALLQLQPGWAEQRAQDWWEGVVASVQGVLAKLTNCEVVALSLSGQMHGLVALDKHQQVIRNPILWCDQRTQVQCDEITRVAGGLESLLGHTNNMMLTGYTGGKLLWLKQHEPQHYERTVCVLNPKDYIRFLLCGELTTEVSDASGTGLFDVEHRQFAKTLIEAIGLDSALFPRCTESTQVVGTITAQAAQLTGLPVGLPVLAGGGDAVISTVGMGLTAPGRVGITLGTSGVVAATLPGYAHNREGLLQLFCANEANTWMAFGCTLSAAGSYEWFAQALAQPQSFRELDEAALDVAPGSGGLLFLPYLMGERCPVFDGEARGAFVGIDATMQRGHFARAVMEGVSYSLKQVYEVIQAASPAFSTSELVVAGGGSKSTLWRQIIADLFDLPVTTVTGGEEGGAYGAALVAGIGGGFWTDLTQAATLITPTSQTLPNPQHSEAYQQGYSRYSKLYQALKGVYA